MGTTSKTPITDEDVAAYGRDGAVALRGAFDMDWIDLLRAGVERKRSRQSGLVSCIGLIFHALRHFLIRFSRRIASAIVE